MESLYKIIRNMMGREQHSVTTSNKVENGTPQERLYNKWGLDKYLLSKSMCFTPKDKSRPLVDEDFYGEVTPKTIMGLIPDPLARLLLDSDFRLRYNNGGIGNSYDPRKNLAVVKGTDDFLHEIGHGLWYNLITPDEEAKKQATIESFSKQERQPLRNHQIPTMHKQYAELVGAFSGQFLVESHPCNRLNDLEEHFARNFDYLLKGKLLHALPTTNAGVRDFLEFYKGLGIIDKEFAEFYKASILSCYGTRLLNITPIDEIVDGDRISSRLIERVAKIKARIKQQ